MGEGFLVHDGESVTLQKLCEGIAQALGVKPITTHIPYSVAYAAASFMEIVWKMLRIQKRPLLTTYAVKNLGSQLRFGIGKAERVLGWKPKISFAKGFEETMVWLKTLDITQLKMK